MTGGRSGVLPGLMTGILLVMMLTLLVVLLSHPSASVPPNQVGLPHDRILEMNQGGSGAARHAAILWPGWLFGFSIVALLSCCIALGASRNDTPAGPKWALLLGFLATGSVLTLLFYTYRSYMYGARETMFLALPAPTAWMIYGLWAAPLVFMLVYVLGFRRWILTPEDEEKFRNIITARKTREPRDPA